MFSIKNESKVNKIILFILIGIFLILCFSSFAIHKEDAIMGDFDLMNNDDVRYLRSAWTLLETGRYTYRFPEQDTVFIMPGLTTVLAGFVAMFGKYPILPFQIFQAILGAISLYILFLICRKYFNSIAALISVFLATIYFPNIYVTNVILTEQIFSFLFILMFLVGTYAIEENKMKYYVWGGIILGLMTLFRPTILLFPLVVFAMWLIKKYKWKEIFKYGFMVIAIVCTMLSPWIIRNAVVFHKFIPLTISSGNPFLQGTYIDYDQSVNETENINYERIIREEGKINVDEFMKNEIVTDQIETKKGLIRVKEVMTKEPLKYLHWYTIGKTIQNWYLPFLWMPMFNIDPSYTFYTVEHYIFLILGVLGIIRLIRKKKLKGIMWMLILTIIYFNVSHLPFYCFARYMYPIMFIVMMYGGYYISSLIGKLKIKASYKIPNV